ncbi:MULTISPECIES: GNAT family N-acetyltransferase [Staphylococcus]|uniref:GNAT family N-acetyltransferase n=1 Tax=Staphylococcus hsinchuensis TaxID=3051183 RepID=A0ABZ3EB95_9STAP|nr:MULTISPECIES: GNAT family N-acetyltransferase [unclassified Staphylococcus]
MIRNGEIKDIPKIIQIVDEAKRLMREDDNTQWDEYYPVEEHFEEDIKTNTLFVLEEQSEVIAFIVVDQQQSEWYDYFEWPIDREGAYVIHRLAALPGYKGAATQLFDFAVNMALEHDIHVMLTDTFSLNKRAQGLFTKFGFTKAGEAEVNYHPFDKGKPFYAYYKTIKE